MRLVGALPLVGVLRLVGAFAAELPADAVDLEEPGQQDGQQRVATEGRHRDPGEQERVVRGRGRARAAEELQGQRQVAIAAVARAQTEPGGQVGEPGLGAAREHAQELRHRIGVRRSASQVAATEPPGDERRAAEGRGAGQPEPVEPAPALVLPPGRDLR